MNTTIQGNHVVVTFEYYTGEAAGQNMVTICTQKICEVIMSDSPIKAINFFVEGNFSGDKKAVSKSLHYVRGKRVSAEIVLTKSILNSVLKTNASNMENYWRASSLASIQSGSTGVQGHFANGLTALFIATGQDVACVSESSIGITRMEKTQEDDLYVSVTLPSLVVGTVGGGTWLPTQSACLKYLKCIGKDSSKKLAEIAACIVLAGEISIAAALAEGHFTKAHQSLGRK
jgi:hydroxymethylglutaryl-CoA reductase (NADPH)